MVASGCWCPNCWRLWIRALSEIIAKAPTQNPVLLQRNPAICAAELDGEVCLFHPDNAEYLNLNATGSAIWTLLETPLTADDLIERLLERYAVDEQTCRQDTDQFLSQALERGMLLGVGESV
jgi:hypothetical protein